MLPDEPPPSPMHIPLSPCLIAIIRKIKRKKKKKRKEKKKRKRKGDGKEKKS
jgi:hypothetical protein